MGFKPIAIEEPRFLFKRGFPLAQADSLIECSVTNVLVAVETRAICYWTGFCFPIIHVV